MTYQHPPIPEGERCLCFLCCPRPTITAAEAAADVSKREPQAWELAAWCGLGEGEALAFVKRMRLSWLYQDARAERDAVADLEEARQRRDEAEQGELQRELRPPRVAVPGGGFA